MSADVILFQSPQRRARDGAHHKRSPEEVEIEARARQRALLDGADAIRTRLEALAKLPPEDAPRMAQNLGALIARRFPGREREILEEIVKDAWPHADPHNILSKRRRFVRWPGEDAPPRRSSQDYDVKPAKFMAIADAIAARSQDGRLDQSDRKRDCLRRLVEGTSIDGEEHRIRRRTDSAAQETVAALDAMLARIARNVDIKSYFDAFEEHRFTHCAPVRDEWGWPVESDRAPFLRIGAAVDGDDKYVFGPVGADMWDGMSSRNNHDNWNGDFAFFPSIPLGTVCLPVEPERRALSLRVPDRQAIVAALADEDEEALRRCVQDAFLQVHGEDAEYLLKLGDTLWPTRRPNQEMVIEAWDRCLGRAGGTRKRTLIERMPLELVTLRDHSSRESRLALYMPFAGDYNPEHFMGVGRAQGGDEDETSPLPLRELGRRHDEFGAIRFTVDADGQVRLFLDLLFDILAEHEAPFVPRIQYVTGGGLDLMLRPFGLTFAAVDGPHFDLAFEHHPERHAPVPPASLAGAILRNLAHSEGDARLDVRLEEECRRLAGAMDAILHDEDRRYRAGIARLSDNAGK